MKTYLLLGDRVIDQLEMCELDKAGKNIEVGQLGDLVGGQGEILEVRNRAREVGLDGRDLVASQEKRLEAG